MSATRRGLLHVIRVPGLLAYQAGVARQEALAAACTGGGPDTLLVCEHPPVFTVGKRCTTHNVRATPEELAAAGASVEYTLRGGDVTFHGPGQLVLYPVVHLRRGGLGARAFVEGLEDVLVALAARHSVAASGRMPGAPGVWVGADTAHARKLGAVGVRVSGGVSTHGCALNVATDLRWFSHIVPCGIPDKGVTSLAQETGRAVTIDDVAPAAGAAFAAHFGYQEIRDY